jgi:tetratricopeptide (TPR) repeat protein
MRSADAALRRLLARTASIASVTALAGCATFSNPPATPKQPAAGMGKAAVTAAAAKPQAGQQAQAKPAEAKPGAAKLAERVAEAAAAPPQPALPPIAPAVQRAYDAAREALKAGRMAEAERGFVALTKSNPELAGPFANLALVLRRAGKHQEAAAHLEKAVQLSPRRADLYNQLGVTYRFAGDFVKARAAYEQALALDANYAPAVLNLGILHDLYLWDGERAAELYDRYLQLAGDDANVKRWVSDLKNRSRKAAAAPKEQG